MQRYTPKSRFATAMTGARKAKATAKSIAAASGRAASGRTRRAPSTPRAPPEPSAPDEEAASVLVQESEAESPSEDLADDDQANPDMSKCTIAQRRTFHTFFSDLSPEIQRQWNALSQKGGPRIGKHAKRRELINFAVPRHTPTAIAPRARNLSKSIISHHKKFSDEKSLGVTRTELRAKLGDTFFQEGLDTGDIIEDPVDKLFFMRSREKKVEKSLLKEKIGTMDYSCEETGEWMGAVAAMMNASSDWLVDVDSGAASSGDNRAASPSTDMADDALLEKLQQSFDASQLLRMNVAKCGQELMRATTLTDEGVQMVRRGLALSKNLLEAKIIVIKFCSKQ